MMARTLVMAAICVAAIKACGNKPPEPAMSEDVDPLLASVQAACATVVANATDGAAISASLGAPDPEHVGTPVIKPHDPLFSLARVSTGPDGDVRGVQLSLAEPSATLAATLHSAWGPGADVPMMPGGAQKRAWSHDLGEANAHVCMVIAALRPSDGSWDEGKVEAVTLRPDPRL